MNYCELTTYISALANIIAKNLNDKEIDLVASIFIQLGDTLTTISSKKALCSEN